MRYPFVCLVIFSLGFLSGWFSSRPYSGSTKPDFRKEDKPGKITKDGDIEWKNLGPVTESGEPHCLNHDLSGCPPKPKSEWLKTRTGYLLGSCYKDANNKVECPKYADTLAPPQK